jgi:steroid 5-alpha reductase family enzyme
MGCIFRLTIESSSGPQDVDADIQMFTAITDYFILALAGKRKWKRDFQKYQQKTRKFTPQTIRL